MYQRYGVFFLLHLFLKRYTDFEQETTESYQPPEANPMAGVGAGTGPAGAPPMPHPVLSSGKDPFCMEI